MHQRDLLAESAVARIGRTVIFFGDNYARFLRKRAARVANFQLVANEQRTHRGQAA